MYLLYIGIYVNVDKKVTRKNCKRTIRYQRPTPPVPATYADVRLPKEYKLTTNIQQFLQYDNYKNAKKQNVNLLTHQTIGKD
jgi:hypothetical protein